jgi:Tol biopolymer transport system component
MRLRGSCLLFVITLIPLAPVMVEAQPTTTRVSVSSAGEQANSYSWFPAISADGRWVAFWSWANNLVTGDTNGTFDVFLYDRQTGNTTRVSVGSGGTEGNGESGPPSINADGRYVAFRSSASTLVAGDTNGVSDIFVHDRHVGTTTRVSLGPGEAQGNGHSSGAAISADGRWVAFSSAASNLVPADVNALQDVFVHDRQNKSQCHS